MGGIGDPVFKRDLYARAGVREYWVLDVGGRQLVVHRKLQDGKFLEVETVAEKDTVSAEFWTSGSVSVASLVG